MTTPENEHPQSETTQPIPPVPHPTNPFTPPHPAAPADQRALYEAAQREAAQREAADRAAAGAGAAAAAGAAGAAVPAHTAPMPYVGAAPAAPGAQAQPVNPWFPDQPAVATQAPAKKRGAWLPVTSAAAVGALVAGIAVFGITHDDGPDGASPASLATIGQTSNDAVPVSGSTSDDPDWQAVSKAVQPSVVAIAVTTSQGGAQGSGVIIDDAGHIVTNNHVVAGAEGKVSVTLTDGRIFDATVVGTDPTTDLAVIKLDKAPSGLVPAAIGDSAGVVVGEPVMAVGNPLGLANTVTTGIVSAVDRPVSTQGENGGAGTVTNAIQIDAAVNPGNSGGPLFDAQGRVIGINSSIATLSSQSGSIGLGFAIPSNLVKNVAAQLIESGTAKHAFLGVGLNDGTATADGVTRAGAKIESVSDGSPAAAADLKVGDVVVAINDKPVGGAESLTAYVRSLTSGDKATLTIVRDGKALDVDVTLATREDATQQAPQQSTPDQSSPDQSTPDQSAPDNGSGQGPNLDQLTPEQLYKWFQEQQGGGDGSSQGNQG
ncbi:S1C family serine protease [Cellulomonas edaphi]|uniref:Trypsin-like peptidase domain-containing protein n=1 Tax=Cellulomonas edaphi TaxID=3053468 RepID=A0ABT7S9C1_9CELL|nr:trypsin-like peptidase domain-containing protein [Cellulomons edaphi]MDM7832223.1 trypsin-like peptidase domain-containing protein [Cellulomons edaphi]